MCHNPTPPTCPRLTCALARRVLCSDGDCCDSDAGTQLKLPKDRLRKLREGGRGRFDIQAGVDRSKFVAHMPGPISQAFYRAPGMLDHLAAMRQQKKQEDHQQTGKL